MSPIPVHDSPDRPTFDVSAWDGDDPVTAGALAPLASGSTVIGIGESAHFVAEFNDARVRIVERLATAHDVTAVALEIGHDEAPAIQEWLCGAREELLKELVGPLTYALYGSFLTELRRRLPVDHGLRVLGVDLPNALTIEPSLAPLAAIIAQIDPDATELAEQARKLAQNVTGGSAAASATAWMGLDRATQDALTVAVARLQGRVDAIGGARAESSDADAWRTARQLATTAATTDLMLRAMADLFSGGGRIDDTTLRERFVASRLLEAVEGLQPGERIAYVAHNNHIQKAPVLFGGVLTAYPAGSFLATALGGRYTAIAVTHRDDTVPEMVYPATTDVGFRVERVDAAPIDADGFEGAVRGDAQRLPVTVVRPASATSAAGASSASADDTLTTMRSQSATTELSISAFDAALVFATASTDPILGDLNLLG
ncbi:erythromycin esterase family protein [Microbacterium sp. Mu-80]|uniref:Erythromycin esterase family protein n=1 Tax=Microbacterium bandirmense TaxID=3122050 RepID=A0ABU8LED3_9MICO